MQAQFCYIHICKDFEIPNKKGGGGVTNITSVCKGVAGGKCEQKWGSSLKIHFSTH